MGTSIDALNAEISSLEQWKISARWKGWDKSKYNGNLLSQVK